MSEANPIPSEAQITAFLRISIPPDVLSLPPTTLSLSDAMIAQHWVAALIEIPKVAFYAPRARALVLTKEEFVELRRLVVAHHCRN